MCLNAWLLARCVSVHPEGHSTSQLDQGFPWFSSVLEQMLNQSLHSLLFMQPSAKLTSFYFLNTALAKRSKYLNNAGKRCRYNNLDICLFTNVVYCSKYGGLREGISWYFIVRNLAEMVYYGELNRY